MQHSSCELAARNQVLAELTPTATYYAVATLPLTERSIAKKGSRCVYVSAAPRTYGDYRAATVAYA